MRLSPGFALTMLSCAALAACDSGSTEPGGSTAVVFESLHAGREHACGLTADDVAYCWGANVFGQLGTGDSADHFDPTPVAGGHRFRAIDTRWDHTCGLTEEAIAYCWGWNAGAQLGDGTFDDSPVPVAVDGAPILGTIAAGVLHTCGLTPGGVAYCWGSDEEGQLGDGTAAGSRAEPMPVLSDSAFTLISAGDAHTCALAAGGTAYCWGSNGNGQLGTGASGPAIASPVVAAAGLMFTQISASVHDYTCGIAADFTAYCWGHNDFAQLGRDTVSESLVEVSPIASPLSFRSIVTGTFHTCALASDGSAHCWGGLGLGETGDGSSGSGAASQETPVPVAGELTFRSLTIGLHVTCGVSVDDVPYCWGDNASGQFGNGETSDVSASEPIPAAGHD